MLAIAVCDDDKAALSYIAKEIESQFRGIKMECSIACYLEGTDLLRQIKTTDPFDILFLDIDMPDINGIELGKYLRKLREDCLIIFVSNREDCVFQSLMVKPFRFIRKNRFDEEIPQVVRDIQQELSEIKSHHIVINVNKSVVSLDPYKIVYIECTNKTQTVHMEQKTIDINYKLSELEEMLHPFGFIRIHKGYLVNYRYIFSIERTEVVLDTGDKLPVSKYRLTDVKEEFRRLSL